METEHPTPSASSSNRGAAPDSDPDGIGLPPGAILPDAKKFRRDQLWSWVVSNAIGLAVLLGMWVVASDHPKLILFCAAVLGASLILNVIRWAMAAAEVRKSNAH